MNNCGIAFGDDVLSVPQSGTLHTKHLYILEFHIKEKLT